MINFWSDARSAGFCVNAAKGPLIFAKCTLHLVFFLSVSLSDKCIVFFHIYFPVN